MSRNIASYPFSNGAGDVDPEQQHWSRQQEERNNREHALPQLRAELDCLDYSTKCSYAIAKTTSPDQVSDQHLSRFLYAEGYDAKLAAKRVANYWSHRHKVFGEDYTLPITLSGAMKNHMHSLSDGYLNLLPLKDSLGRAIIYCNPIKLNSAVFENQIRVWWYLLHVIMEDEIAMRNGFIIISNAKGTSLSNFDSKSTAAICTSHRVFPIRWCQIHCCHSNPVFPLVASIVKAVLSREQRESFVLHNGTCEEVVASLTASGIKRECVPTDLGGCVTVSPDDFVRKRMAIEESLVESNGESQYCPKTTEKSVVRIPAKVPTIPIISKQVASSSKQSVRPGRLGDPRMNAAVNLKLQNPDLPLLEALVRGGFVFEANKPGIKSSEVKDKDGVTVYQRRNQLLRRLRKERNRR